MKNFYNSERWVRNAPGEHFSQAALRRSPDPTAGAALANIERGRRRRKRKHHRKRKNYFPIKPREIPIFKPEVFLHGR
jgi:hypothetical protein